VEQAANIILAFVTTWTILNVFSFNQVKILIIFVNLAVGVT
jgi:hypothetical protein